MGVRGRGWIVSSAVLWSLGSCSDDSAGAAHVGDAAADSGPTPAAVSGEFAAVRDILLRSCAYQRCHSGVPIGGSLPLNRDVDIPAMLIDVPACEYPEMMRVKPGDPEHSWLYVKLTAKVRPRSDKWYDFIEFEPAAGFDPEQRACRPPLPEDAPLFGQRMPLTAPNMLPPEEIEVIRRWIADGALH